MYVLGDKRFELLKHLNAIEFTAQPFLPIKEPSLMYNINYTFILLDFINPVQLPLHEPYFDLTLIRITHTKISIAKSKI
jgi:hypothetical protein